jgi:hypothetical protein
VKTDDEAPELAGGDPGDEGRLTSDYLTLDLYVRHPNGGKSVLTI